VGVLNGELGNAKRGGGTLGEWDLTAALHGSPLQNENVDERAEGARDGE